MRRVAEALDVDAVVSEAVEAPGVGARRRVGMARHHRDRVPAPPKLARDAEGDDSVPAEKSGRN
jgi:hypothetical protein